MKISKMKISVRKNMRLKSIYCLLLVISIFFTATGCIDKSRLRAEFTSGNEAETTTEPAAQAEMNGAADIHGDISIRSSVAVLPFLLSISERESADNKVNVLAVGRDTSIEAVINGECDAAIFEDIGGVKPYNASYERELAYCGIKIIAHKDSGFENISKNEIVSIFTGDEIELCGKKIDLVLPDKDMCQRMVFEQLYPLMGKVGGRMKSLIPNDSEICDCDARIAEAVAANPSAIGVVSLSVACPDVIELSVDGVSPSDIVNYPAKGVVKIIYGDGAKAPVENFLSEMSGSEDLFVNNGLRPLL
jgi:ABC-type phosphate transport system substrate-binding protein